LSAEVDPQPDEPAGAAKQKYQVGSFAPVDALMAECSRLVSLVSLARLRTDR